jgi:hypothetical protein
MKSTRLHDALRRTSFDTADRRGNNPHGTREQAEAEGRRLNGFRYETVTQAERSLDRRSTMGEAPLPVQPKSSGGGGSGLFWLLAAGAGIALLSALSSDDGVDDADDADDELAPAPSPSLPLRENPSPATAAPHITVNLTMPHAPAPTTLVSNPAPVSEPVHVTIPVMAPIITAPLDPPPPVVANPLPEAVKKRRKKTA